MKYVAVIGAGTMGAGIAAQLANNDCQVILFDLIKDGHLIAANSLQQFLKSNSTALVHPSKADFIQPASIEQDLSLLQHCDLVIEAIVENLTVKQDFYHKASAYLQPTTIIASNTSTFQLQQLKNTLPADLAAKIVICHFFNPPRYMRLLELITDESLSFDEKQNLRDFLTNIAGKYVIDCKDTPGFIANRIGCFLLELVFKYANQQKIDVTAIDYVFNKYLGFPSTGIFGLYDLIGLDVMQLISRSLVSSLPKDDLYCRVFNYPSLELEQHISQGYKGRKGLGGFYRFTKNDQGEKVKEVLSFTDWQYHPLPQVNLPYNSLRELLADQTELSKVIAEVIGHFCWYILMNHQQISNHICDIDKVMQLGYGWKKGPFTLMKEVIGFDWLVSQFKATDLSIPDFIKEELQHSIYPESFSIEPSSLAKYVTGKSPVLSNNSAKVWAIKKTSELSHVSSTKLCFEITTKSSTINSQVFELLDQAVGLAEKQRMTLIIYSDYKYFCAGGDLNIFLQQAQQKDIAATQQLIELGQKVFYRLKHASIPVVSCARGLALGGGCELLLHSHYIVAHQDLVAGLVEVNLGLIPGWGGLKEMVFRADNLVELETNLGLILSQFKSQSAADFAERFRVNGTQYQQVICLANNDNLLEYALSCEFDGRDDLQTLPKKLALNFSITELNLFIPQDDPNTTSIADLIANKIKTTVTDLSNNHNQIGLTEEQLLTIEKEIFLTLIARSTTPDKIQRVIK